MDLKVDQWATVIPSGFPGAITPVLGKRQEGWNNGEEPAAAHFNWAFQGVADTQNEIANAITGLGVALDPADLKQLLAGIQRQTAKASIRGLRLAKDNGSGTLRGVAVGGPDGPTNSRIMAVGDSGLILSSDGYGSLSTRTPASSFAGTFCDVRWSPFYSEHVMVGDNQEVQSINASMTVTRRHTGTGSSATFRALAMDDSTGRIVAVGDSNTVWTSSGSLNSWADRHGASFSGTPNIVSVAYGAGRFVCGTSNGDVASSDDLGVTWIVRLATAGSSAGVYCRVHYHSTLGWLYHYDTKVYWSSDGTTWTLIQSSVAPSSAGPGLFVAPYCWMIAYSGGVGCFVEGRYGHTASAAVDFRLDHISDALLTALRFSRNELVAIGGSKLYVGGST